MSLIQSIPDLLYVILFVISLSYLTYASPPEGTDVTEAPKQRGFFHYLMQAFLERVDLNKIEGRNNNGRVKRQSSASKLQDSAKMPGSKILMLMLSMISNMFTTDPVGGVHPMSPQNARPVVKLFKEKIIGFLFPKPGKAQN